MENWKSGDVAICVRVDHLYGGNGQVPPLRLNAEYMVQAVKTCECGNVALDIGLPLIPDKKDKRIRGVLCRCGATSSPSSGIWWCGAERFVKKQTRSIEEQIEEAVSQENYELADNLQKQKDK
jgi:hypothetical protein